MSALLAAYRQREPTERALLELLAAACDGLTMSQIATCLHHLGFAAPGGKRHNTHTVTAPLLALEDAGLVERPSRYQLVEPLVEPLLAELIAAERFEELAAVVARQQPLPDLERGAKVRPGVVCRELRRALWAGDHQRLTELLRLWELNTKQLGRAPRVASWLDHPAGLEHIRRVEPALAGLLLEDLSRLRFETAGASLIELARELAAAHPRIPRLRTALAREALLAGELAEAERALDGASPLEGTALLGMLTLLRGDTDGAAKVWAKALSMHRKLYKDLPLPGPEGALLPLAYLLQGSDTRRKQATRILDRAPWHLTQPAGWLAGHLHLERLDALVQGHPLPEARPAEHPLGVLLAGLVRWWAGESLDSGALDTARRRAEASGHRWLATELDALLVGDTRRAVPGARALVSLRQRSAAWERRLEAMEALLAEVGPDGGRPVAAGPGARLAWFLRMGRDQLELEARSQKRQGDGWSKGRPAAVKRVKNDPGSVAGLTDQDKAIAACASIRVHRHWGRYNEEEVRWDPERAWRALLGHPAVFDAEEPTLRIDILERPPRLELTERGDRLRLRLEPRPAAGRSVVVRRAAPERVEVTPFEEPQLRAAEVLGQGLELPAEARDRMATLVGRLTGLFELHQDASLDAEARELPHDPRPVLRLRPSGPGLAAQLRVRPFGQGGPVLEPGQGAELLLARIDGRGCQVRRDLAAERREADAMEAALPSLAAAAWRGDDRWLEGIEPALELLVELEPLGDRVRVEWPEGEPLRLRGELGSDALFLSVRGRGDWFSASAQLRVDGRLVLELSRLLELMEGRPRRFVQLDDGQFIALTSSLQRHLDLLDRVGGGAGDTLRLHPLHAGALAPMLGELGGVDADEAWRLQVQAMSAPEPREHPPPRGLKAELRPYQREGFAWLARLADLGAGACLADDMGLGKTVQVLALLLQRAWLGPAIVVAPTSVCGGWCEQAWRFAPGLQVHRFGPGDRESLLDSLGPGDLVVCSYGLLQAERERFAGVRWSTAVLDEAQAIKNPNTQRHQAACALQAEQRIVTTGTPIENHIGELWALFRFLNPGLLGSWDRFRVRYAEPIEAGSRELRQQLRRIVLPFILRRTKGAVLQDLPPRSEVRVDLDLLPEERALYEALRERAEQYLDSLDEPQPLQILAQLSKLRMACCNAALVLEEGIAPPSAKLEAFAEIVQQLREGGHRALVFSQFVRHLALLRSWLDARGVAYQYLDGSTPAAQRDRAVRAFQGGEGELFLISLRAGGFGLNLTAADYVLHMDPWWNPAVEDQASDRAHRIGQQRPVTVYRLIARGTIEERILELHAHKRELADKLLEGSDAAARMTAKELLSLIRGG